MGSIWVREFTGGLDTRRLPETASGAVLIEAVDGHLDRGGQWEKRPAFVPTYDLPLGTVGLVAGKNGLFAFGSGAPPTMPHGVRYQRLQHPDGTTALVRILSADLYKGRIYCSAEFADGSRHHFYDGVLVAHMTDGRARAAIQVISGSVTPAVAASATLTITAGSSGVGNQIASITIGGVDALGGAVNFGLSSTDTAAALAAAITSFASTPDYVAEADGASVTISAVAAGAAPNGREVVVVANGDVVVSGDAEMAGGAPELRSTLAALTIDGVSVIDEPVEWAGSAAIMAEDIATAINTAESEPEYVAVSVGDKVIVMSSLPGVEANGRAPAVTTANDLVLVVEDELGGGVGTSSSFVPGTFVKTIGSRVHAVSESLEHFSGIGEPTKWTTDTPGAGFIDMSTHAAGSERLTSLATYQSFVAVFAERVVQIWLIDSDPANNDKQQVLNNTGTASPHSVTQFGDNDLFYLDESGIRSLRARDSSNSASTMDIGVPIDTLVTEKLATLTESERAAIVGLIEPRDGRFWLCMKDTIFVFSYFPGVKISAWSTYRPAWNGERFDVEAAAVFRRRVYVRSGDTVYTFGGQGDELEYDDTVAIAAPPFLDAGQPARSKTFIGMDVACTGQWRVDISLTPTDPVAKDTGPIAYETTYGKPKIPITGESTHIGLRFASVGPGAAVLGAFVIHFEGDADED